jgi:lysophospholipase L1-like esterase
MVVAGALLVAAVALVVRLDGRAPLVDAALIEPRVLDAAGASGDGGGAGGSAASRSDRPDRDVPAPSLAPVADGDEDGELVVLFGDSLSESAAAQAADLFADDPDVRLSANQYGGTQLDTPIWVEGYEHVGEGAVVLLLLGTNDISTDSIAGAEGDAVAAIDALTDAGADRVVVATVSTTGRPPDQSPAWTSRARAFNDWLRMADTNPYRYPTLQVVDWDDISRGRTEWLAFDGIHHSPAGSTAYAEMAHRAAREALGLPDVP